MNTDPTHPLSKHLKIQIKFKLLMNQERPSKNKKITIKFHIRGNFMSKLLAYEQQKVTILILIVKINKQTDIRKEKNNSE